MFLLKNNSPASLQTTGQLLQCDEQALRLKSMFIYIISRSPLSFDSRISGFFCSQQGQGPFHIGIMQPHQLRAKGNQLCERRPFHASKCLQSYLVYVPKFTKSKLPLPNYFMKTMLCLWPHNELNSMLPMCIVELLAPMTILFIQGSYLSFADPKRIAIKRVYKHLGSGRLC